METPMEQLPDTKAVEGWYGTLQSPHNNATEFLGLFNILEYQRVRAVDHQHITVGDEMYLQIQPYVYQSVETGRKLAFCEKDGNIYKMSCMLDYIKICPITYFSMIGQIAGFGLLVLTMLITMIALLIKLIRKRGKLVDLIP